MDENERIKQELKRLQDNEQAKFDELKKKLALDYPVNTLIKDKVMGKEAKYLKLHQEAKERCSTLKEMNLELKDNLKQAEKRKE